MMFLCSETEEILLLLRASWVAQGGSWGIPGGGLSEGWRSTPMKPVVGEKRFWDKALREVEEECSSLPPGFKKSQVVDKTVYEDCGFRYVTFIADLTRAQRAGWQLESLDDETDEFRWFPLGLVTEGERLAGRPLHFGVVFTLMNARVFQSL